MRPHGDALFLALAALLLGPTAQAQPGIGVLVLLAPGHVPQGYSTSPRLKLVRDSIEEARTLVAATKSDSSVYLEVKASHLRTPGVASDAVVDWIRKAVAE